MIKLEQLKAAHEAATGGEWDYFVGDNATPPYCSVTAIHGDNILRHRLGVTGQAQNDVMFVALSHNMMPQLLEAADLLSWAFRNLDDSKHEHLRDQIRDVLEKLK